MTEPKKPLSETGIGRMMDERIKALAEAQAKRDAEQDAKLSRRPSVAAAAVGAMEKFDFTTAYPKSSVAIGLLMLAASTVAHALKYLDTIPMYVLWGLAVCLIPGLAMRAVRLATGLRKAKGE